MASVAGRRGDVSSDAARSAKIRARLIVAALTLLSVVLSACFQPVGPARTFDSYKHKAKHTAETALSAIETARLAATTAKDDDAFPPFIAVVLSDAEGEGTNAHTTFDKVQPPNGKADDLRDELDALLVRADDALSKTRIAARRADFDEVAKQAKPLAMSAKELKAFIEAHS